MNIYFKNINVINPYENLNDILNIWIKDGAIAFIGKDEPKIDMNTEIISSEHLVCAPGFFDMHVHLREPGFEYKEDIESGANAAANGGFTGILCMPNTNPPIDNPQVVEFIKEKAKKHLVDVEVSGALTQGRNGKAISPMFELNEYGVKMFTDDGDCVMNSDVMRRAFEYAGTKDLLISQHCEDHSLTENFSANEGVISGKLGLKGYPHIAEEIIIDRDIKLAEYCGNIRYHVSHISTKGAVNIIRDAKARGQRITCEVTPHHLTLTDEVLTNYDTRHKMNPPLRTKEDLDALIAGLVDGTIDCIATDHAPHSLHEKHVEFDKAPNGIIGLETAVGITLNYLVNPGYLTLEQFINIISVNPRNILNLAKIFLKTGEMANLTIFDPNEKWIVDKSKFNSKSKNTPFNNYELKGKPVYVINNNQIHKCLL